MLFLRSNVMLHALRMMLDNFSSNFESKLRKIYFCGKLAIKGYIYRRNYAPMRYLQTKVPKNRTTLNKDSLSVYYLLNVSISV